MDTPIDPLRIPVLNLTADEIADAEILIAEGKLPKNWFQLCKEAAARNTFGEGFRRDRQGNPIEMGIGSEFGMTRNSIEAYRRYNSNAPDFERQIAKMEKQLVVANERRRAEAAAK
jgi:hypothetical protein